MYWLPRPSSVPPESEQLYVGIRRDAVWTAYPIEQLTEQHLRGVDVRTDIQAALLADQLPAEEVATVIARHAAFGVDPHVALWVERSGCSGLTRLRARLREEGYGPEARDGDASS